MTKRAFADLSRETVKCGRTWKAESLKFFTNAANGELCDADTFEVNGGARQIPVRSEGFEALGIWQTPDCDASDAAGHRLQKGSQAFWKDAKVYLFTSLAISARFDRYSQRVVSVVCRGRGSWARSRGLAVRLERWGGGAFHSRRIARLKRRPNEGSASCSRRAVRFAKRQYVDEGFVPSSVRVLRASFSLLSRAVPDASTPRGHRPERASFYETWSVGEHAIDDVPRRRVRR